MKRLKHTASINDEALPEVTCPEYEFNYVDIGNVDAVKGITAKEVYRFWGAPSRARRVVRVGDTIVSTVRTYLRATAPIREPDDHLIVSTGFAVVRPRGIDPDYLSYALRSPFFVETVVLRSTGVSYPAINASEIGTIPIPIPTLADQRVIAAFLNRETARVDTLIEKKKRQIELLHEKRIALIHEKRIALIHEAIQNAATQNLRVGYVANQIQRPIKRTDDEIYVPIGLYNRGRGIFHKEPTVGAELGDSDFFWVEANDLILSGQFAWEGAVALAGEEDAGCVATHRYPILSGKPGLMDTAYLFAFFTTKTGDFLLNEHSRGAAGRNRPLNTGTLLKEMILVPPMAAQLSVSKHVYFERRFRRIVATSIKLLAEYRTAIISAAVTGKIDVRNLPKPQSEAARQTGEVA